MRGPHVRVAGIDGNATRSMARMLKKPIDVPPHSNAVNATRTLNTAGALAPPLPIRVRIVGRPSSERPPPSGVLRNSARTQRRDLRLIAEATAADGEERIEQRDNKSKESSAQLSRGTLTIGAGSNCDLVIADESVSRRHIELELIPEGVLVRDLGSRNGTFYLGQRVERMIVSPPALLRAGNTTIAIELDPAALAAGEPLRLAGFRGMVGTSEAMQRLFGSIVRLDGSLVPTLLLGETGVGKELVARAVHEGSRAAEGPFVAVNCGALARELVGSTLFGHRRGAFTGATDTRRGAFGVAQGGTLFLDEIGELPLEMQPALLRALETGEITPIGDDTSQKVNVRIIAATNRDLATEVRAGRFREDLYFRIAVVTLKIPPLRNRPEDVTPLAELFARQEGHPGLSAEVLRNLARRPFPGNVRELRNAVRAFVAIGTLNDDGGGDGRGGGSGAMPIHAGGSIDDVLRESLRLDIPYLTQRDLLVERFTNLYVDQLLAETGGNQTTAAKLAGLDRTYFGRLLSKIGRR